MKCRMFDQKQPTRLLELTKYQKKKIKIHNIPNSIQTCSSSSPRRSRSLCMFRTYRIAHGVLFAGGFTLDSHVILGLWLSLSLSLSLPWRRPRLGLRDQPPLVAFPHDLSQDGHASSELIGQRVDVVSAQGGSAPAPAPRAAQAPRTTRIGGVALHAFQAECGGPVVAGVLDRDGGARQGEVGGEGGRP